jgi:DNA sulfur modification protein DndC
MTAMIQNDAEKEWMLPLLELRNKLDFRAMGPNADRELRDYRRMSGLVQVTTKKDESGERAGENIPGPYLQSARENWLRELLKAQTWIRVNGPKDVKDLELITLDELQEIRRIWVVEKHEMEDSLPRIYREVSGEPYPGPRLDDSMAIHAADLALLREECTDDQLHFELTRELIGITRQSQQEQKRSGHFDLMEKTFAKHYFDSADDAISSAKTKAERRAPLKAPNKEASK